MSFPYINPISPIQLIGTQSVSRDKTYGTNYSTLSVGGYMEVYSLEQLSYFIPPFTYGPINYSANTIPINFSVGSGSTFSYNTLVLNSDNISSGRKKLGMLVYVKNENQVYQFNINNYDSLWNAATGATGVGGSTVIISSFGTTVKANTPEGIAFISGWTANTIDGVSGYTYETAVWKKYYANNLAVTGGTYNSGTLILTNITGGTVTITGFTGNYFTQQNNVRSWSLTNKNLSVGTQDTAPTGLFFKPDGTKMYLIGGTNERVNQFTLSTPWDVTTAVVDVTSLPIQSADTAMNDIYISPDGLILYSVGSTNDRVYRFNLSTPWDVSTGVFANQLSVGSFALLPTGLYFKPDGTKLFIMNDDTVDTVFALDMSTPWDITTAVQTQSIVVSPRVTGGQAVSFNDNGSSMFILGNSGDDITQFNLSTPWDVSTAVYLTEGFRFQTEGAPGGLYYNETANVAYVVGTGLDTVFGLDTSTNLIQTSNIIESDGLFVTGQTQINGNTTLNQNLFVASTITAGSSISSSGNLSVAGSGQMATAPNIGNSTTPVTHSFANGFTISGGTKIANIGNNGLLGSTTVVNLGHTVNTTLNSVSTSNNFTRSISAGGVITSEGIVITNSATGAIEFQDTFTEAVTIALQSHIPNIGLGWTKTYAGTATNVNVFSAGYALPATTASNTGVIYTTNNTFSTSDYELTTDITAWTSGDDVLWVYFRFQDLNNYYALRISLTTTDFRLYKRVGGVLTGIFTTIGFSPESTPQLLTVRVIGSSITLLLGSTVLGTYYDTDITLPGQCGIGFGNTGVGFTADDMSAVWRLDNFQVRMYRPSDISGTSYFNGGSVVVGNTSANTSAKLEVVSTSQGFLPPRMTNTQRTSIGSPSQGLIVYDTTGSTEGLYYYGSGSTIGWQKVLTNSSPVNLTGFSNGNILFASGSTGLITGSTNLFWDNTNGRLGVGTSNPSYRVDVTGTTLVDSSVSAQGSFNLNPVTNPPSITGFTLSAGSSLSVGVYYYRVVYVTALGETGTSGLLIVNTTSGNTTVNLSGIPISSDPRVTARKLYRTAVNNSIDNQRFLATISNNTTTTYTDTIPDASLGTVILQAYKVNTTSRYVTVNGTQGMILDSNLTTLGLNAGAGIISSSGSAIRSVFIGTGAGQSVTTGQENTTVGGLAGGFLTTGNYNTIMGGLAGYLLTTASSNTLIGYQTARYLTTGSNNTIVGGNAANSLIDGVTQFSAGTNNTVVGRVIRMLTASDTNSIVIGDAANGLGSNTAVIGNDSIVRTALKGNVLIGTTTDAGYKLDVNGTARIQTSTISPTFSGNTLNSTGLYGSSFLNAGDPNGLINIRGGNTRGGSSYLDFIRASNDTVGTINGSKTIRINNIGSMEFINDAYSSTIFSLGDNGANGFPRPASTVSNDATSNYLYFNSNASQIYDDGNMHIHSRSANQSLWINTNNGVIILGNQSSVSGGSPASSIIMGSSTTIKAYTNIYGSKTYTIGSYGFLSTGGAGTGGGTTAPYSLYCDNRIEASEFDATSDERMKNIQGGIELSEAIKLVTTIKPIKYTWKSGEDKGLKTGYSAQQVEKSGFKHLIGHIPNEDLVESTDEDGFTSPDGFQLTMNYDQVIPYHGVVINYLLDEIKNLKKEIELLKSK